MHMHDLRFRLLVEGARTRGSHSNSLRHHGDTSFARVDHRGEERDLITDSKHERFITVTGINEII